ncbi:PTPRN [Acanthosepion pharaonis]|uniref:PTPRN n=1 Tax=Acanthosepion pharaonis TaxID=158019 RepID=A0A812DSE0_ACAPH|nr:PTPRN [Sepia pharaonis]
MLKPSVINNQSVICHWPQKRNFPFQKVHHDDLEASTGLKLSTAGIGNEVKVEETAGKTPKYYTLTFALCGSIATALLAVVIFYMFKRQHFSRQKMGQLGNPDTAEASKDYQDLCRQKMQSKTSEKPEPLHAAATRIASVSEAQVRSPSSRSSTSSWSEEPVTSNMDISTGHIVLSYMEDHLQNKDRLDQEWEALSFLSFCHFYNLSSFYPLISLSLPQHLFSLSLLFLLLAFVFFLSFCHFYKLLLLFNFSIISITSLLHSFFSYSIHSTNPFFLPEFLRQSFVTIQNASFGGKWRLHLLKHWNKINQDEDTYFHHQFFLSFFFCTHFHFQLILSLFSFFFCTHFHFQLFLSLFSFFFCTHFHFQLFLSLFSFFFCTHFHFQLFLSLFSFFFCTHFHFQLFLSLFSFFFYDHSRVVLNQSANASASDYINASTITDHDPRNPAYIATQGPLPHTVADFWQMVWEQGSVVIVMLTKLTENGEAMCHRYWPEEGSDLYHIYEVRYLNYHKRNGFSLCS